MSTHAGRVAVITGASRGLGAGLAETFALNGMLLGLCARTRPASHDGQTALVLIGKHLGTRMSTSNPKRFPSWWNMEYTIS